jgi:hypothetical protein
LRCPRRRRRCRQSRAALRSYLHRQNISVSKIR